MDDMVVAKMDASISNPLKNVEEKGLKFCRATRSSKTPKIIDYCSFYWNSLTLAAVTDRLPEIIWIKKNTSVKSASSYRASVDANTACVQSSRPHINYNLSGHIMYMAAFYTLQK